MGDNIIWWCWTLVYALIAAVIATALQYVLGLYEHVLLLDVASGVATAAAVRGFGHVRSLVRKADECIEKADKCVDKAATFMETADKVEAACINLDERVGTLERATKQVVDSPIAKYVAATATKPEAASAAGKALESLGKRGDGDLAEDEAAGLLEEVAERLDPSKKGVYENEKINFQRVRDALSKMPCFMRSTDMRRPQRWDIDSQLHAFTTSVANSAWTQEPRWNNFQGALAGKRNRRIPTSIGQAIRKCLSNFDERQIALKKPLSHARRWIGCSRWNPDGTDGALQGLARHLFHGCENEKDARSCAGSLKEAFSSREKSADVCRQCDFHKNPCPGVSVEKVLHLTGPEKQNWTPLLRRSIYEASTLYLPALYWPPSATLKTSLRNGLIASLPQHALLQVDDSTDDLSLTTDDPTMCDWCRILFWHRTDLAGEEAQVDLWDHVMAVPTFWVDPNSGLSAASGDEAEALADYFLRRKVDYILLGPSRFDPTTCAFWTEVPVGKPAHSQLFGKDSDIEDAKVKFTSLLKFLADGHGTDCTERQMLAAQALRV